MLIALLASIPLVVRAATLSWIASIGVPAASSFSTFDGSQDTLTIVDGAYILQPSIPTWKNTPPKPPFKVLGESAYPTAERIFLPGDMIPRSAGQCVAWVQYHAGVNYSGNAIGWRQYINSETPEPGDIIVLSMTYWGHVGIVLSVKNGEVTYRSRNQDGLWVVSDTTLPADDIRILGYIRVE